MSYGTLKTTGVPGLNFGPYEVFHDSRRGMYVKQRVGADAGNLAALLTELRAVQAAGGSGRLTISADDPSYEYELAGVPAGIGVEELFFDDWQLPSNELTDTIFANPLIKQHLNYNDLVVLERVMLDGGFISDAVENSNLDITFNGLKAPNPVNGGTATNQFQAPQSTDYVAQIYREIKKGQTEYLDPKIILHHTSCCSPGAVYNAIRANEMCIYTPAQLLTEVGSGWTYNLPPRLYSQISTFPIQTAPTEEAAFYLWGWLKKRATQGTQTNGMIEVHQEYELGLWSTIRYSPR